MATSRRAVLAGLAAASVLGALGWAAAGNPAYLAAAKQRSGAHALYGLDAEGAVLFAVPLPDRGHAAAAHPDRAEAIGFARRPGRFGLVIDCRDGRVIRQLAPPEGRQFNGHGAFSTDGRLLYTSEVVAEGSAGRIGIWDAGNGYRRLGEWDSHGIGPHEIRVLPEGRIAVANGGIETDPQDRTKLNLDRMRPNLTWISDEGVLLRTLSLPEDLAQNSIRHLAPLPDGVAFAMQWQGDPALAVPLLGLARGDEITTCAPPLAEARAMKGYAGSIAASNGMLAVTSPRGGVAMIFDDQGTHVATLRRADLCGAAPRAGGFMLTDGGGAVWAADPSGLRLLARHAVAWDNHLISIRG